MISSSNQWFSLRNCGFLKFLVWRVHFLARFSRSVAVGGRFGTLNFFPEVIKVGTSLSSLIFEQL
ncbi:hypothetical protein LguiA_002248 [Lonicera macranthoides]